MNRRQDAAKGVVRGNPRGEIDEAGQPVLLLAAKLFDLRGAVRYRNDRRDHKKQKGIQRVRAATDDPRVFHHFEALLKRQFLSMRHATLRWWAKLLRSDQRIFRSALDSGNPNPHPYAKF
jgi:hypothetical protein